MNDIQTHFDMLLSREEQERIGVTPDKSDSIRVMRVLAEYDRLLSENARLAAGTFTLCRFLADQRPMTPEERDVTDKFFLSLFDPNAPAGAQPLAMT